MQTTVAATLQRPMELKAGQVGGASWEVHKVGAKVQLERYFLVIPGLSLCL